MVVTANNYMFRPLTGHHQVVQQMERGWGLYNIQCDFCLMRCRSLYQIHYNQVKLGRTKQVSKVRKN